MAVSSTISTRVYNALVWVSDDMSLSKPPAIQYVVTHNTVLETVSTSVRKCIGLALIR